MFTLRYSAVDAFTGYIKGMQVNKISKRVDIYIYIYKANLTLIGGDNQNDREE